jgi:hypothetical protein
MAGPDDCAREEIMRTMTRNVEADAIEAAYEAHVRTLFVALTTNLGDMPVSRQTEKQCVDRFKTGLNTARRARRLALGVAGAEIPALAAVPMRRGKYKRR